MALRKNNSFSSNSLPTLPYCSSYLCLKFGSFSNFIQIPISGKDYDFFLGLSNLSIPIPSPLIPLPSYPQKHPPPTPTPKKPSSPTPPPSRPLHSILSLLPLENISTTSSPNEKPNIPYCQEWRGALGCIWNETKKFLQRGRKYFLSITQKHENFEVCSTKQ